MSFETTALLVTWIALVLLALVVAGLVRQVHALTSGDGPHAPEIGLVPGATAPNAARLEPVNGEPLLVLFLSTACGTCVDIFEFARSLPAAGSMRAVYELDGPADNEGLRVIDQAKGLFTSYRVPATPYAVLIGADGRVSKAEPIGSVSALAPLVKELAVGLNAQEMIKEGAQ